MARRHVHQAAPPARVDDHHAVGVRDRQRAQHNGVDRTEDGRRGANPETQRQDGHQEEAGSGDHLPQREGRVVSQFREVLRESHANLALMSNRPAGAARLAQIAESFQRSPLRLLGGHAALHQLAASHGEMEFELAVDFFVDLRAAEAQREALTELHASGRLQDSGHGAREAHPFGRARGELRPAERRDPVELRSSADLGRAPFGLDQAAQFEAVERRVERPFLDVQLIAGGLLEPAGDAVAVAGPLGDGSEDERLERAVE